MATKIDDDVKRMTISQLRREVMRFRNAFRKELNETGNRRCWLNLMEAIEGKKIDPIDIPESTFIANCTRYYRRNK